MLTSRPSSCRQLLDQQGLGIKRRRRRNSRGCRSRGRGATSHKPTCAGRAAPLIAAITRALPDRLRSFWWPDPPFCSCPRIQYRCWTPNLAQQRNPAASAHVRAAGCVAIRPAPRHQKPFRQARIAVKTADLRAVDCAMTQSAAAITAGWSQRRKGLVCSSLRATSMARTEQPVGVAVSRRLGRRNVRCNAAMFSGSTRTARSAGWPRCTRARNRPACRPASRREAPERGAHLRRRPLEQAAAAGAEQRVAAKDGARKRGRRGGRECMAANRQDSDRSARG